jgi:hypothetical protein
VCGWFIGIYWHYQREQRPISGLRIVFQLFGIVLDGRSIPSPPWTKMTWLGCSFSLVQSFGVINWPKNGAIPCVENPWHPSGFSGFFRVVFSPKENGGITIPIAIAGIRPLLAKWPCYLDLHPPGAGRDCRCWVWIKILYSDWMVNTIRKD